MNRALAHYYRAARAHQLATYGNSNLFIDGRDAREFTGGGAAYGLHAVAAIGTARRQIHFIKTREEEQAARRKQSRAARKRAARA